MIAYLICTVLALGILLAMVTVMLRLRRRGWIRPVPPRGADSREHWPPL